ncbi:hypothetical protein Purlil1_13081 [Purpureocillium lilacinum]|uniref:Uncharacterized protein n=1 Tax=Purpureocillium lilacinum TaxID=33203 RepID=A0ABR0BF54_PURLI|nr:hypothetical protein Purlil1_13081 [Purpureocillium lilacinum]
MDNVIEHLAATKVGEFLALCGVMGHGEDETIKRSIHNLVELVRKARSQQASHEKLVDPKSSFRSKDCWTPAEASGRPCPPSESNGTKRNYPASGEVATERPKQENGRQALDAPDHYSIRTGINREWRTAAPNMVRFETLTAGVEHPWKPDGQRTESAVTNSEFQSTRTQGTSTLPSQITTPGTEARRPVDYSSEPRMALASPVGRHVAPIISMADMPAMFESTSAVRVMESILLGCQALNGVLSRHTLHDEDLQAPKTSHIHRYAQALTRRAYHDAVAMVVKQHALDARRHMQVRYYQTTYWNIIRKRAECLNPATLPTSKGRLDEFTMAQKIATREFMEQIDYSTKVANQRRCRRLWKRLSDIREAGAERILFYRTKEFDTYCVLYPEESEVPLVQRVLGWEHTYGPYIAQLESRVMYTCQDFSGKGEHF